MYEEESFFQTRPGALSSSPSSPGSKLLPISSLSLWETAGGVCKGIFPPRATAGSDFTYFLRGRKGLDARWVGLTGGRSCVL